MPHKAGFGLLPHWSQNLAHAHGGMHSISACLSLEQTCARGSPIPSVQQGLGVSWVAWCAWVPPLPPDMAVPVAWPLHLPAR